MKVTSKMNQKHLAIMQEIFQRAQILACEEIKSDLQDSQTLPFDTGALQKNIFVDKDDVKKRIVRIVHEGLPYTRRLYFHPEYKFRKDKNPKAGGLWFETYLNGYKKEMPHIVFAKMVKKEMRDVINKH